MDSMARRLGAASLLVLALFVAGTATALLQAYRSSGESALRARLMSDIYGLLGATEVGPGGRLSMPADLPQQRLQVPGSGLYAWIDAPSGRMWSSRSTLGLPAVEVPRLEPARTRFRHLQTEGPALWQLSFGVVWETADGEYPLVFSVAEGAEELDARLSAFRDNLLWWLGGAAVLLLVVQVLVLRWGLSPLRRIAADLRQLEAGDEPVLGGRYPQELRPLTDGINQLLRSERSRRARYRDALADLAHSLKTPLAVLRSSTGAGGDDERTRRDAVDRMDEIIQYQLRRAAASGAAAMTAPVRVRPVAEQLSRSLAKVHADRGLGFDIDIPPALAAAVDRGDLLEVLGNLMDNACKWARQRVGVRAWSEDSGLPGERSLCLEVTDDGPGIDPALIGRVHERGVRAVGGADDPHAAPDALDPGHGIGLAVVHAIALSYDGTLRLDNRTQGGASARVEFHVRR